MQMRIYTCMNSHTYLWNQHIPLNAWYGQDKHSWWFCTAHERTDDYSLELYRFNGTRWIKRREYSPTTKAIWKWAEMRDLWWTKCHWFKAEDKEQRSVTEHDNYIKYLENLMHHDRTHKKSSMGVRLDKENYYAAITYTDYECRKITLHDFRRTFI